MVKLIMLLWRHLQVRQDASVGARHLKAVNIFDVFRSNGLCQTSRAYESMKTTYRKTVWHKNEGIISIWRTRSAY